MKYILSAIVLFFAFEGPAQTSISGDIVTLINSKINTLPGSFTNVYSAPSASDIEEWNSLILNIVEENYSDAATKASGLGYELFEVTNDDKVYYMLTKTDDSSNYWGTYVFNSKACRSNLVIQSPHPIADRNTGKQGVFVFKEVDAYAFFLSGTHRCNNTTFSACSGTTTICSGSSSEKYRISDAAHNTNSAYQVTTEVIKDQINPYFIQLHGFSKESSDPYVIMSNGARVLTGADKLTELKNQLAAEDNSLTFKLSHIDLGWNKLLAFTNTQGRYINNSLDPCGTNATIATGRFIHIEQEYEKLRSAESKWLLMANAIENTFSCGAVTGLESGFNGLKVFPNPGSESFVFESTNPKSYKVCISNTLGNLIKTFTLVSKSKISISSWENGIYIYQIFDHDNLVDSGKIIKQ